MKKALSFVFTVVVSLAYVGAQTPDYYNYNTGGSGNSFPFNIDMGKKIQLLYLPNDFNQPGPTPSGTIESVAFRMIADLGPFTYTSISISMGQTSITGFTAGSFYAGPMTLVYSGTNVNLSAATNDWLTFTLDTPFPYDSAQSLVIEIEQCGATGASGFSTARQSMPGIRRITSLVSTSCPFGYGNENSYVHHCGINFMAGGGAPEIGVSGNNNGIMSGDVTPDTSDFTEFGAIPECSGSGSNVFTIHNTGTTDLNLTGVPYVQITGPDSADFTVTSQPTSPITPGDSSQFTISFDPGGTGLRTATVNIANDDADEGNYTYAIQGTGLIDSLAPVLDSVSLPLLTGCSVTITTFPTAIDDCAGTVTGTTTDSLTYTTPGNYTVTWTYDDGNGNISTETQNVTVVDCSGLETETLNLDVQIFPNPSDGLINLMLSELPEEPLSFRVINGLGQIVSSGMITQESQILDLSAFKTGVYHLQLYNSSGHLIKRIIISD